MGWHYPPAPVGGQVDDYHGVKVSDPYRWLEDLDSPRTKAWVASQNELTARVLRGIPQRAAFRARLTELMGHEFQGVPIHRGGRYFWRMNNGRWSQSVVCTAVAWAGAPTVVLDANKLSNDGRTVLTEVVPSWDGVLLAYGVAEAGSDWETWRIREVGTGRDLPDEVRWMKFTKPAWSGDNQGFYYSRFAEPAGTNLLQFLSRSNRLYYHRLGSPQAVDSVVCERPGHPDWFFDPEVTEDGRYLIITVTRGTEVRNGVMYQDLEHPEQPIVELLKDFDAEYQFVGHDGPVFWMRTDWGASRGRLVAIDTRRPERENWQELIGPAGDKLAQVSVGGEGFACHYLREARSALTLHRFDGTKVREVALPGLGSVGGLEGRPRDREAFFSFTSPTMPFTTYRLDLLTGQAVAVRPPKLVFNPSEYRTEQVWSASKDGTRVPMFLSCRQGLKLDGNAPAYLQGYGGFAECRPPRYSAADLLWMEQGGLCAWSGVRGGGEFGEEWHRAGMRDKKQNGFDDFVAAAEWLIARRYTRRERLAIGGSSNGGLLVGVCLVQRPDLFAAVLADGAVLDMLRFDQFTFGWAWRSEYGTPDSPDDFRVLYAYSPLHNLREGVRYPAMLLTVGDHDDRVVPAHSFKFAARLQACQAGPAPVLIRIATGVGHGRGATGASRIEEAADRLAFLARALQLN